MNAETYYKIEALTQRVSEAEAKLDKFKVALIVSIIIGVVGWIF